MQVKDIMTASPAFILETTTLQEAAQKMAALDCGFLPIGSDDRLHGVITDRDIAVRGTGMGLPPTTHVSDIMTEQVLYCYQDDTTDAVARNMAENQVRRLIVLDNKSTKRLVGVVALCDVVNGAKIKDQLASQLIKGVSQQDTLSKAA